MTRTVAEIVAWVESNLPSWREYHPSEVSAVGIRRDELFALVEAAKQRDELLAACKALLAFINDDKVPGYEIVGICVEDDAKAAIARAEFTTGPTSEGGAK